jgi:glycogen debranching enzyme GlgX
MEGVTPTVAGPNLPAMQPGQPWPLGAHWDGSGINFAVYSAHAQAMEVCIFDDAGRVELARYTLPQHSNGVWHGYLPQAALGLVYGLRAHGPWRPERGHRFNAHKLLLDPYAREVVGQFEWRDEHFAQDRPFPLQLDSRDNAAFALKARVMGRRFEWGDDHPPQTATAKTVLYEVHVKGFSKLNPQIPQPLRGSYAGLAHEASLAHFKRLGVTAISLMPVHLALDEERLAKLGLHNYWGYNTLGFFCVDPRLASHTPGVTAQGEFRQMVKTLHQAGLEVILDVVYNHTAESDETGPSLSFRGLDNASYYRLKADAPAHYDNPTGCGNALNISHPRVLQLVMDSLRYWVSDLHVDGFRFDLAPVLGRGPDGFSRHNAFFTAIAQDPILSRVKLIAEPWDVGHNGYQVGNFPNAWLEWNDQFRDGMRRFWLHADWPSNTRGDFALRLCGSSDVYQSRQRAPAESVNYVVSHDGFTLHDLVSYNKRHNQANGENNHDGHGHNFGFNCGAEGPTANAAINTQRSRLKRALLATTLLAQGTPLLCAGDELGHSQRGNNNPYCQDNETTWINWQHADDDLIAFTARVLALRHAALPFANHWYSGLPDKHGLQDLTWLQADGSALHGEAWQNATAHVMACLIGQPGLAKTPLLLLINPEHAARPFMLPAGVWQALLDTSHPRGMSDWHGQGDVAFELPAHSLVVMAAAGHGLVLPPV